MNKILSKFLMSFLFVFTLIGIMTTNVYAIQVNDVELDKTEGKNFIDDIIGIANGFKNQSTENNQAAEAMNKSLKDIINDIGGAVFYIGNFVFFICAIFLGVKYISQSSQGKADIKAGMSNLLVGAIFFYSGELVYRFANGSLVEVLSETTTESMMGKVFGTIVPIAQMLAFGALIFTGLKYMFASSKEKAKIKGQLIPLAVGIMLVFATTSIINFALSAANDILK